MYIHITCIKNITIHLLGFRLVVLKVGGSANIFFKVFPGILLKESDCFFGVLEHQRRNHLMKPCFSLRFVTTISIRFN